MSATWVQLAAEGGDVIFNSVTASFSGSFSGSISGTASSATNADTASEAPRYTTTASFNSFSSSYVNASASFNTRINEVTNATGGFVTTQSFQAFTQSMHSFTSSITSQVNLIAATYATTASNLFRGNQIVSGSITVTDTITAQRLVVQTITSSIIYSSGSNIFGDELSDTQQFTGSVSVTGSLALNGSQVILTNQTSSMSVLFAQTASYVESVQTASEAPKYTLTASFQPFTQSMHTFTQSINQTVANVYASESNYTTTASFNAYTSSNDIVVANVYASESNYTPTASFNAFTASITSYTASVNTQLANIYASESNYTLTSSFNAFSSSYSTDSGSFNNRINTNSSSFSTFSGSYSTDSGSFDLRIKNLSSSVSTDSSSFDNRISTNSASFSIFSGSYVIDSASFDNRIDSMTNATGGYVTTQSFQTFTSSMHSFTQSITNTVNNVYASESNYTPTASFNAYTASTNTQIANVYASESNYTPTASFNAFTSSITSYTASVNTQLANIYASESNYTTTASFNAYTASTNTQITNVYSSQSNYTTTASFNAFTSSYNTGSFSGSFVGTASYADQANSASYAVSSSYALSSSYAVSSSYATTSSYADDFLVKGTITAQRLVVQTISSSIIFSSGSNTFGNDLANQQIFTGSVHVTGSLDVNGSPVIVTSQTSSMVVLSSSYANNATSASYAANSTSASYATVATSASYAANATTASYWSGSIATSSYAFSASQAESASYWSGSIATSSYAFSSSVAVSSSYALTASYAANVPVTASYANQANSASYALTASYWSGSIDTASYAFSASQATSASYWSGSIATASYSLQSLSASLAQIAISASFATTAAFAMNGGGGGVSAIYISDEGALQGTASYFDFNGSGVTATVSNGTASITIPGATGGGGIEGQNVVLNQSSPATTWSFSHNLGTLYPVFTIFDSNDDVIIPQQIHAATTNSALIYFSSPRAGHAVASLGGGIVSSSYAVSSSYSFSSTSASYALSSSYAVSSSKAVSSSYALSSSYAATSSYATNLIVSGSITNVNYIDFNTGSATPAYKSGRVFWDNIDGCLNVYNSEADITLQVGQENWTRVRNNTGTAITNGTIVRIIGAQGDAPTVERAQSIVKSGSINTDTQILGVATHTIEDASFGYVTTQGLVRGLNTSAFNDGDTLFVNTGSAGQLTNVAPSAPYEIIPVGVCIKASPGGSGIIYVAVQQPLDFSDLSSVEIKGSYSYGDLWTYVPSGSFGVWIHTNQLSGSYGLTGSLQATSFTGSLLGTASYALSSSYATVSTTAATASSADSFTVRGTLTAQRIVVETITSSVVYSSGSNVFGNSVSNTQQFTGSVSVTGSLTVLGSPVILTNQTSSMVVLSSSYALTSSQATNVVGAANRILFNSATNTTTTSNNLTWEDSTNLMTLGSATGTAGTISKIALYTSSYGGYGLGVSPAQLDYVSDGSHVFYKNGVTPTELVRIANNGDVGISGSLAVNGSNVILTNQTASMSVASSSYALTSSYAATASYALNVPVTSAYADNANSASYALTASYALNAGAGAGFPYSGSAVITGSLYVSGSSISGSFTGSLLGTASYATQALSSSFATYAISASNAPGFTVQYSQATPAATWSFNHNLNTRNPIVQVYDSSYKQIIPNEIVATTGLTTEIRFDHAETGYVVFSNGGGLYITGSMSQLNQNIAAVTWSFQHNLNSKYVNFEVYDSNDLVIIPAGIRALNSNQAELYFGVAQTGIAVANFSGISGSTNAMTASYALVATSASYASASTYAATASYSDAFSIGLSLNNYATLVSSSVGSNTVLTKATGSYTAAFFKYTVSSGSNARTGEVFTVWNGNSVEYADVTTNDIGTTVDVTGSAALSSGNIQFNMQTNSGGWKVKTIATFI